MTPCEAVFTSCEKLENPLPITTLTQRACGKSDQRWGERDGCGRSPRLAKTLEAANGHTASLLVWDSCAAGVEVAALSGA